MMSPSFSTRSLRGRTARSLAYLLSKFERVKIYFVSPPELQMQPDILEHLDEHGVWYALEPDIDTVFRQIDDVYQTRILPERLASISLSFLVDSMSKQRGGIAPNIAYSMALLGERPRVMATVGEDFAEYRTWLEAKGVDTSLMQTIPGLFTASFFATTDQASAQIASFYPGAMGQAATQSLKDVTPRPDLVVISSLIVVSSLDACLVSSTDRGRG